MSGYRPPGAVRAHARGERASAGGCRSRPTSRATGRGSWPACPGRAAAGAAASRSTGGVPVPVPPLQGHLAHRARRGGPGGAADRRREPGRVLEVGNVLSHYRAQRHVVVDKYEEAPGILNRDVLELGDLGESSSWSWRSRRSSTSGWDEEPRRPEAALEAVQARCASRLAPGGQARADPPGGLQPAPRRRAPLRGGAARANGARCGEPAGGRAGSRCRPRRRGAPRTTSCSTPPARSCSLRSSDQVPAPCGVLPARSRAGRCSRSSPAASSTSRA